MSNEFYEKIMSENNLSDIIKQFSPNAGSIIQDLMITYKHAYGPNGSSYFFVWSSLETLIKQHEKYGYFERVDGDEKHRMVVLHLLTSELYNEGIKQLRAKGQITPRGFKD